jgi:hypothetical protein
MFLLGNNLPSEELRKNDTHEMYGYLASISPEPPFIFRVTNGMNSLRRTCIISIFLFSLLAVSAGSDIYAQ